MMASGPQKRASPDGDHDQPSAKRPRTTSPASHTMLEPLFSITPTPPVIPLPTAEEQARSGLRRSIGLALKHVGFGCTSEAALERYTELAEEYILSMAEEVRLFALASRRTQPIPTDFDVSLKRFNLGTNLLRPHLKTPVPKTKLAPMHITPTLVSTDADQRHLPLLGEELSGRTEKESKPYIPKSFPDFPSIHTYRATPQDVDEVTVHGTGLKWSDTGTPIGATSAAEELLYQAGAREDPRRIREVAARESKQAEEALRGVLRASKINTLKEARLAAQRNVHSRLRYDLWESTMRELIEDGGKGKGSGGGGKTLAVLSSAREEIADHSMIINAQKVFHRQEVSRVGKRAAGEIAAVQ